MLKLRRILRPQAVRRLCTGSGNKEDKPPELPEEPTNCCMSGCDNCVWIQYAKDLTRIYEDGGSTARQLVLKKITDPTLKVFLQMELKSLDKTTKDSS